MLKIPAISVSPRHRKEFAVDAANRKLNRCIQHYVCQFSQVTENAKRKKGRRECSFVGERGRGDADTINRITNNARLILREKLNRATT